MSPSVIVYSTTNCSFCQRAKQLLSKLHIPFTEHMLDNDPETRQRLATENNGYRTVPMIFVEDRFVGGYTELAALHRDGKLSHLMPNG